MTAILSPTKLLAAVAYNERHARKLEGGVPTNGSHLAILVAIAQQRAGVLVDGKWGDDTTRLLDAEVGQALPDPFTRADALARMDKVTAPDVQSYYLLGAGGSAKSPLWPAWPWNDKHQSDCSAALGWFNDYPRNDGDWNTDRVVDDVVVYDSIKHVIKSVRVGTRFELVGYVDNGTGTITMVKPGDQLLPGDSVVYGGIYDPKTGQRTKPGHCAGIRELGVGFTNTDPGWPRHMEIVHSSPGNSRLLGSGHAIARTDARIFGGLMQGGKEPDAAYAARPKPIRLFVRLKAFAD